MNNQPNSNPISIGDTPTDSIIQIIAAAYADGRRDSLLDEDTPFTENFETHVKFQTQKYIQENFDKSIPIDSVSTNLPLESK